MSIFIGAHNIVSPLGFKSPENFEAIVKGHTALQKQQFGFSETLFCCARIDKTKLDQAFSSHGDPEHHTHLEKMCILSIQDTVSQTGTDLRDKNNLLILSTTKGNIDVLENTYGTIPPQRAYLPEFAKTVGDFFECGNSPVIVSNACISGLLAMIVAKRLLENKNYKNIIVCGGDIVSEFTLSGFKSFNALSENPCRPFDARRNGINLGEAAASTLLSLDQISNVIISSGASANDANHISGPSRSGSGLFQAINQALKEAGKTSVDLISAHGTATEYNDEMESVAFSHSGLSDIPLNSLKGYYGHTLGAAGILESILSIQSLTQDILIGSAGFEDPGTTQPVNMIRKTERRDLQSCLKTASGFGGCNAAAIFEKL